MVWAKLDDEILDNEKIGNAGVLGFAMHVAAITWCCRKTTDGFVPYPRVRLLLDLSDLGAEVIEATGSPEGWKDKAAGALSDLGAVQADRIAQKLVSVGLWREDEERGGYWVHDFLDYNPSKAEAEASRKAVQETKSRAGKKGAEARWGRGARAQAMAPSEAVAVADSVAPAMAEPMAAGWQKPRQDGGRAMAPIPIPIPRDQDPPSRAGAHESSVVPEARPDWAEAEVEGVSANTGETFDLPIVWLTYQAKRESESRAVSPADFRRFLGSWASRQKSDRIKERDRPPPVRRGAQATLQPFDENAPWMKAGES